MYLIVWVTALHAVGAAVWSGCRALHGQGGAGWGGSGDSQRMRRSGWDLGLALGVGFALSPPWLPAEEGGGVRRRGAWRAGVVPNPSYSGALYFHSSSALCYCSVTSLSPTPHLLPLGMICFVFGSPGVPRWQCQLLPCPFWMWQMSKPLN